MSRHLTDQQVQSYRKLPLQDLLEMEAHVAKCEGCRIRLSRSLTDSAEVLNSYFAEREPDHLVFEQLKAYVDGFLDETDREMMESHLSLCQQCAEDEADLRRTKQDLLAAPLDGNPSFLSQARFLWKSPEYSFAFRAVTMAAAAALVALLAGFPYRGSMKKDLQTQNQELKERIQILEKSQKPEAAGEKTFLVSLLDGNSLVRMDESGALYGLDVYPKAYHDRIRAVFAHASLPSPPWLRDLGGPNGIVRGETGAEPGKFEVIRPVGVVVESDRPLFQWKSCPGASHYQVKIYGSKFQVVASSPDLNSRSWSPSASLDRGEIYSWQVDAFTRDGIVTVPLAPAPEAKFKVLEQHKAQELEEIRSRNPGAHLLLAALYAENGLLEEAGRELEGLKKANPDSMFVTKLAVK